MKRIAVGILFLITFQVIFSQNKQVYFDNFTTQDGLSDNYINCVYQDFSGWIWIATGMGVMKFDGINFQNYPLIVNDSVQKDDFLARNFYQTIDSTLYVCIEDLGLAKYNPEKNTFERLIFDGHQVLTDVSVKDLCEDNNHNLWAATKNGVCYIDFSAQTIKYLTKENSGLSNNYVRKVLLDENNNLWIGTKSGLDRFNLNSKKIYKFSDTIETLNDDIKDLLFVNESELWVGTSNYGIVVINTLSNSTTNFIPEKNNPRSVQVNCIFKDSTDEIFLGTRGGLYICNNQQEILHWLVYDDYNSNSLVHNSILNISKDAKGDLWISTRGGISYLVKEKQCFETYKAFRDNNRYLNNGEVYCIWLPNDNEVWMGTESGGVNILNRQTGLFSYLTTENGLPSNCIKSIKALDDENVLIGSFYGGLTLYNRKTKKLRNFLPDNKKNSISSNVIWDIEVDKNNNAWIATFAGLTKFDPNNFTFAHYDEFNDSVNGISWIWMDVNDDMWLGSSNEIFIFNENKGTTDTLHLNGRSVYLDSKGTYWIMTSNIGIIQYNKQKGIVNNFKEIDGLASNLTYKMLEDSSGRLWISTAKGLSCFYPDSNVFQNFYSYNGLQGNEYNYAAAAKSSSGELLFGGKYGLTIIDPEKIITNNYKPPVYITELKIFNKKVIPSQEKSAILKNSISETRQVQIPYKKRVITIEFAGLNYTNSEHNKYKYKLKGFDEDWIEANTSRSATYTNLDPGEYTFHVIASNDNNVWNYNGTMLDVKILSPYYKQLWFIITVFTVLFMLTVLVIYYIFRRRELAKQYDFEKERAKKLHDIDSFKLKLFTNISHEIKTPLTLIISPLRNILKKDLPMSEIKDSLILMEKNATHLLNLVSQLLDFKKIQNDKLNLELKSGDIVRFTKNIFYSFEDLMKENDLTYSFNAVQSRIITNFDSDKLKKILNNLISNAIRYNNKAGSVKLRLSIAIEESNTNPSTDKSFIKIEVSDSGIGIKNDALPKIFTRFYKDQSQEDIYSSGIGLNFTKELVELHNGMIRVNSMEGQGSVFTVLIPYIECAVNKTDDIPKEKVKSIEFIKTKEFRESHKKQKILLVIEDNKDVAKLISNSFNKNFLVLDSDNGEEGLNIAFEVIPDIIISDIMMPGMNGMEVCEKIKNDVKTSHIPLILLTALDSKENMKDGLTVGADDYITKPFDIEILETKINNLLKLRQSLIKNFSKFNSLQPSKPQIKSLDEKFLEKAVKIVEDQMSDSNLNIDKFVEYMGISRMQLYRKFAALTNMTVKEFVNDIRLKRAKQIFSEKKVSVSEVAYSVGYNDLSYFSTSFKKKFGMAPSDYNQAKTKI